jgi:hypothetical protein
MGPRTGLDPLRNRSIFWSCWKSTHDSSVSSPYASHYIDWAIQGPTSFLIVSTLRRCLLWNQFPTLAFHVTWKIYEQLLPKLCKLISFAYRCVTPVSAHVCILCLSTCLFACVLLLRLYWLFLARYLLTKICNTGSTLGCHGGHYEVCSSVLWCHVIR